MNEAERRLADDLWDFPSDGMDESSDEAHRAYVLGILPPEPLSRAFLDELLAPRSKALQGIMLDFLAGLGRAEVADIAAEGLEAAAAEERFYCACALARLGDPRGFDALEALYRSGLAHPRDLRHWVPWEWIRADVLRKIGTPQALALDERLERLGTPDQQPMDESERTLRDALWEFTHDGIEGDWARRAREAFFRSILPPTPLRTAFLNQVLEPLDVPLRGMVLDLLATVGRAEVADVAATYLDTEHADDRFRFISALVRIGDERGYEALEQLHRAGLAHPGNPRHGVPWAAISTDLLDEVGTPKARAFREHLRRMGTGEPD